MFKTTKIYEINNRPQRVAFASSLTDSSQKAHTHFFFPASPKTNTFVSSLFGQGLKP